jgi:hypothetical protein
MLEGRKRTVKGGESEYNKRKSGEERVAKDERKEKKKRSYIWSVLREYDDTKQSKTQKGWRNGNHVSSSKSVRRRSERTRTRAGRE